MFLDRYQLEGEIGRGGMGMVYRAQDTMIERTVAIKMITSGIDAQERRGRWLAEARAVGKLNHPNIVTIYDVGEYEGQPYIVMEYVDGQELDGKQAQLWGLLNQFGQICDGLSTAHRSGIIHRDLKPANVKLTPDGVIKILDFGLARLAKAPRLTTPGQIVGTVHYLAPEVLMGDDPTEKSDLYAMGVMLYELVTAHPVFPGGDLIQELSQQLYATVTPPTSLNITIPGELEDLMLQLLEKSPRQRPESAEQVGAALRKLAVELQAEGQSAGAAQTPVRRLVRGRFVGREADLKAAAEHWQAALQGQSGTLLLSGEAGIGKTRLAQELAALARSQDGLVLVGRCYSDGNEALEPFCQLTPRLVDQLLQASELGPVALAELVNMAPELGEKFPDIAPNPALEADRAQERAFESVVRLVRLAAQQAPMLLVFEDVHWADEGSLVLLRHLLRRLAARPERILVVLTYREGELVASGLFGEMLDEFLRTLNTRWLRLQALDQKQTGELVQTIFAEPVTPELMDCIFHETEGNPFFVEELCRELVDSGQLRRKAGRWEQPALDSLRVPQNVRTTVEARLVRMPEMAKDVLSMASIFGRTFDAEVLMASGAWGENDLAEALEIAERGQWIQELRQDSSGGALQYGFSHALIRATLYDRVNALRRRRMHRKALAALEEREPEAYEQLAYHAAQGGDAGKTGEYAYRAGERALARYANQDAVRYLEQAVKLDPQGRREAEISRLLGVAYSRIGKWAAAQPQLERAAVLYQQMGDLDATCEAYALLLSGLRIVLGSSTGFKRMQEIETQISDWPDSPGLGRLYHEIGWTYTHEGLGEQGLDAIQHAGRIASAFNLLDLEIEVSASGFPRRQTDLEVWVLEAEDVLHKAEASGIVSAGMARLVNNLSVAYFRLDKTRQYFQVCERASELAARMGDIPSYAARLVNLVNGCINHGDMIKAQEISARLEEILAEHNLPIVEQHLVDIQVQKRYLMNGPMAIDLSKLLPKHPERDINRANWLDVCGACFQVLVEAKELEQGEPMFEAILRIGMEIKNPTAVALGCWGLSLIWRRTQPEGWREHILEWQRLAHELYLGWQSPIARWSLKRMDAWVALVFEDWQLALNCFNRMMPENEEYVLNSVGAYDYLWMARAMQVYAPQQAIEWYRRALGFYEKMGSPYFTSKIREEMAQMGVG